MSTVQSPGTLGGTPQTMPTNNWWDGIGGVIKEGANLVNTAAQNYVQVRQAAAAIASRDVPAQNRPPGTFGLNPQASGIAGGTAQRGAVDGPLAGLSPLVIAAGALAVVFLLVMVRK